MNRNRIIAKTIRKLATLNKGSLRKLIQNIETSSNLEFIHSQINNFLKNEATKEEDVKVIYNKLKQDPFLKTTPHKDALNLIAKEYPFLSK